MSRLWMVFAALGVSALAACGGGNSSDGSDDSNVQPRPVPATREGSVPESPDAGESRPGRGYRIVIPGGEGEDVAFQVFEPTDFEGGETYPLILEGHGFGGSRKTSREGGRPVASANIGMLLDNGYGVISIDQRGHGESGGTVRIMDPDFEGRNLVAILDWAQANLDWLAYGPDADAGTDNMLLGAVGASYGGGFQFVLNAIDPARRLDAMVPQITWNDLTYSLNPGNVIKSGWVVPLYAIGESAGSGLQRLDMDPFVRRTLVNGALNNEIASEGENFFRYHGPGYFCGGRAVATNGGEGTQPDFAPDSPGPVNVMLWQGMRDTLFNFTEAYRNYRCFEQAGGDVRLLSYQSGHNIIPFPLDPDAILSPDVLTTILDTDCGGVDVSGATLAFFDEHLKGREGAADAIPEVCISLSESTDGGSNDYVANAVPVGGETFNVPETIFTTGANLPDAPKPIRLDFAAGGGDVLAGVPELTLNVEHAIGDGTLTGEPIFFVALGRKSALPGVFKRVDNQVTAIRGLGEHTLQLPGVGARLAEGEQLALLLYAIQDQYVVTGNLSLGDILGSLAPLLGDEESLLDLPVVRVRVSGEVSLPLVRDPVNQ